MLETLVRSWVFVVLVALAFVPLELVGPAHPHRRHGFATDFAFATVGRSLTKILLVLGIGRVLEALDAHAWERGPWNALSSGSARTLATVATGLFLFELGGYAYHRLAHRVPVLWRLHAVHHSSESMDWLASFRQHPLEIALMTLAQNLPLVLLGIPLSSHAMVLVVLELNTVFVHSNLRIPEGPWCEVVATPRFHHRHHDRSGAARNFATLFPFFDRLFGTHDASSSSDFGLAEPVADGFFSLVLLRFRTRPEETTTHELPRVP